MKSQHEICRSMSKTVSDSADCVLLQCIRKHLSKSEVTPDTADENSCNNLKKNHTGCCIRQFLGERSFQASSNSSDIMMFLKAMVVLLSSDASTASKSILNCLVPSNADATLFVKERESIADRKLPLISFSGVDVPGSETSLYVCNYGSWEQLRSLVQLVSVDYYAVFGDAHSSLKHESNQTSFMWHLKPYSIRNKHDAGKGKGHIWFWIPVKFTNEFQWLVTKRFNLYSSIIHYSEFLKDHDGIQSINIWKINMVYDSEDDLNFFSNMHSKTLWTEEMMCRYITASSNSTECDPRSCAKAVSKTLETTGNQECRGDLCYGSHDQFHRSNYISDVIEVHEMDFSQIKQEILEDEKCTIVEESSCSKPGKKAPCSRLETLRSLFVDYSKVAARGFHVSEPMLIVQCPACLVEFRGLSNRMLQLLDHINNNHNPRSRKKYVTLIENRYRPLIVMTEKRMKEWRQIESTQGSLK